MQWEVPLQTWTYPENVGAVIGSTKVGGLSFEPLEALKTLYILGALYDESKVQ
jgi:hypothetical protein